MNELIVTRTHEMFGDIRILEKDGEPWFILADVCKALELGNSPETAKRLNAHGISKIDTIENSGFGPRTNTLNIINEPNLYKCVLRSNKPEAEKFQDWICGEILPAIRKHGVYAIDELLDNPDTLIQALTRLKTEREARSLTEKRNTLLEKTFEKIEDNLPHKDEYTAQYLAQKFGIFSEKGLPHSAVVNYLLGCLDPNYDYHESKKDFNLYSGPYFREVYTCAPTGTRYKEMMYNQKAYDVLKFNFDNWLRLSNARTKSGLRVVGNKRKYYYKLFEDCY